jgi:outer membrane protein assembly factor BamB
LVGVQQSGDGTTALGWTQTLSAGGLSSPAAVNDLVFFGTFDNLLRAVTTSGKPVWQFATQSSVISSPAISHSCVYFASNDGNVYCLSLSPAD